MEFSYGLITSAFESWIEHVVTGRPIVEIPTPEAQTLEDDRAGDKVMTGDALTREALSRHDHHTRRRWGTPQPVRTTQHSSRASERRPRPKSKMLGRVALGLGPLVTEEGYTSSGSSDSRDTAERSKEVAVAQDALARRMQVSE